MWRRRRLSFDFTKFFQIHHRHQWHLSKLKIKAAWFAFASFEEQQLFDGNGNFHNWVETLVSRISSLKTKTHFFFVLKCSRSRRFWHLFLTFFHLKALHKLVLILSRSFLNNFTLSSSKNLFVFTEILQNNLFLKDFDSATFVYFAVGVW